jgi:hypothetical protein
MTNEKKKGALLPKIETREDALKAAKDCGNAFLVVAAIQGAVGAFLAPSMLLDAILFAACGYFVRWKQSRVTAVIALVLAFAALATTIMNKVGQNVGGGSNIFLAIIIVGSAIRAVEATFKLHGRFKQEAAVPENT